MNKNQIITLVLVAAVMFAGGYFLGTSLGSIRPESRVALKSDVDSLSYFLGLNIGYSTQSMPEYKNLKAGLIASGMNQVMNDSSAFNQETAQTMFFELRNTMTQREQEKTLREGIEFLAKNKEREGVITTGSGLQYEVITKGEGPMPADTSIVTVHYTGTLIDGTEFDSSVKRGEPATFPLNRVIRGWTEGLQLMPVGSKYKFYIPSSLGYGNRNAGEIPANSVLIFEVELLSID
ncbi:MAG: FKBP-type peptidyl-prolyl cis-trans isomerase [Bacteroidota bacterium]